MKEDAMRKFVRFGSKVFQVFRAEDGQIAAMPLFAGDVKHVDAATLTLRALEARFGWTPVTGSVEKSAIRQPGCSITSVEQLRDLWKAEAASMGRSV